MEEEKGGWTPIERLNTRQIYDRLMQKRMTLKNYIPKKAHKAVHEIQKQMTANEPDTQSYTNEEERE